MAPGDLISTFTVLEPLAQGGMAELALAQRRGTEERVVIKSVRREFAGDREFVQMFLDEARIATALVHPHVVRVFEAGQVGGAPFLAMEYLQGVDFHRALSVSTRGGQGGLSPRRAAVIGEAVASALAYAHTLTDAEGRWLKIVHRDISPGNIFLTDEGGVKLLDFGIARAEGRLHATRRGVVRGKLAYVAPERARGEPGDARSDLFSLGVVLYEALSGTSPFLKGNDVDTIGAVLKTEPRPLHEVRPAVPRRLSDVVHRALQKNPDRRYPSAEQLAQALHSFLLSDFRPPVDEIRELVREVSALLPPRGAQGQGTATLETTAETPLSQGSLSPLPPVTADAPLTRLLREPVEDVETVLNQRLPAVPPPAPAAGAKMGPRDKALVAVLLVGAVVLAGALQPRAEEVVPPPPSRVAEPKPPPRRAAVVATPTPAPVETAAPPLPPAQEEQVPVVAVAPLRPRARGDEGPPGLLTLRCSIRCRIKIDGQPLRGEAPLVAFPLAPGPHQLELESPEVGLIERRNIEIVSERGLELEVMF